MPCPPYRPFSTVSASGHAARSIFWVARFFGGRFAQLAGASESSSGPLHTPQPAPLPGPTDRVVYAIGDIHGRADLLARLHGMILSDAARRGRRAAVAVHLGDYVDRGRESRAVLDRLTDDPLPGLQTAFLCGNHDAWMRAFLDDPEAGRGWLVNGGRETLASYGIPSVSTDPSLRELRRLRADLGAAMPAAHRDFLDGLQLTWREGDYLFVHAGVRPGVPLARQDPDDLINIRQPFLASQSRFDGALVVHGHTIVNTPQVHDNRIALDTGAYATGRLTALVIDGAEISILQT